MNEQNEPQIEKQLASLSTRDIDPWRREQIRREAHGELRRQRARARHPWLARAGRLYDLALEPAMVAALACIYLVWALATVGEILGGRPLP